MGRDLGAFGNGSVDIDWGVIDYNFNDNTGLRIGKMLTPVGLHNETRDIDLLRTTVLLPQSVYDELYRDTAVFRGFTLYGTRDLFRGQVDFKVFNGAFNISDDSTFLGSMGFQIGSQVAQNTNVTIPSPPGRPAPVPEGTTLDIKAESEDFLGGQVFWSPEDANWRVGYSLYSAKIGFGGSVLLSPGGATDRIQHTYDIEKFQVLSFEYSHPRWKATFERADVHAHLKDTNRQRGAIDTEQITEGYYGQLSYRLDDQKELAFTYSQFYPHVEQGKHNDSSGPLEPSHRSYQTDKGLTYRVDLSSRWYVKAEYHRMTGTAHVTLPSSPNFQGESDWDVFMLKSTVRF